MIHCNKFLFSTDDTEGLLLEGKDTSSNSVDYASILFQLFIG